MSQATTTLHSPFVLRRFNRELEALICHRMPHSSQQWIQQYAQQVAGADDRIVLAHLRSDHCHLRLFDANQTKPASSTSSISANNPRGFLRSVHDSDAHVGGWMLHVDAHDEAAHTRALNLIDRWTILTPVDDHTCVGLYALIKSLRQTEKYRLFRSIDIFAVTADPQQARQCVINTNILTSRLLRTNVRYIGHLPRAVPVQSSVLGGFDVTRKKWPQLIQQFKRLSLRAGAVPRHTLRLTSHDSEALL